MAKSHSLLKTHHPVGWGYGPATMLEVVLPPVSLQAWLWPPARPYNVTRQ